jgi:hypothetical protein
MSPVSFAYGLPRPSLPRWRARQLRHDRAIRPCALPQPPAAPVSGALTPPAPSRGADPSMRVRRDPSNTLTFFRLGSVVSGPDLAEVRGDRTSAQQPDSCLRCATRPPRERGGCGAAHRAVASHPLRCIISKVGSRPSSRNSEPGGGAAWAGRFLERRARLWRRRRCRPRR